MTSRESTPIMNWGTGGAQVKLRRAHQCDAQRAERVAERGPLRHRGHRDAAQRDADGRAEHQADGDPPVIDDAFVQQRSGDGQQHSDFAGPDATAGGDGRTQPFKRENEKGGGDQIGNFKDVFAREHDGYGFLGPLALNIFSIRSVIMKPPTMLLVAAMMAMVPRILAMLPL